MRLAVAIAVMGLTILPRLHAQLGGVEGDVTDSNGKTVAGVTVLIKRLDIIGNYTVKTDRKGHFAYGLPLGRFTACVVAGNSGACKGAPVAFETKGLQAAGITLVIPGKGALGPPPPPPPRISDEAAEPPASASRGIVPEPNRGVEPASTGNVSAVTRRAALVIGNDAYTTLPRLKTAVADAEAVAAALKTNYGFETTVLLNARRQQILGALNQDRKDLKPDSDLLIYYAGHGYYDKAVDKAYWLPVDARADDNSMWISADDITTNVKGMPARHVLIVSDSCYSGGLTRSAPINLGATSADRKEMFRKLDQQTSRMLMASGGNEPVSDGGAAGHSIFAAAFLNGLMRMDKQQFTVDELFQEFIREPVAGRSEQSPELSPLRNSGHEGGSFVFVKR